MHTQRVRNRGDSLSLRVQHFDLRAVVTTPLAVAIQAEIVQPPPPGTDLVSHVVRPSEAPRVQQAMKETRRVRHR